MKRIYKSVMKEHFETNRQMLFLVGPRQAGKTTVSLMAKDLADRLTYLNWDNIDHRKIILAGPGRIAEEIGLDKMTKRLPVVIFDEIHKFGKWKGFLKGFYDVYKDRVKIIVTGSAKPDVYKRGGDSLMGRYFRCRLHPLSLAELARVSLGTREIQKPIAIPKDSFKRLLYYGGFPEPYLKGNSRFSNRWKSLRQEQLIREDIRDLSRIQELGQMEILVENLNHHAGELMNYSNLANKINVSVRTITRWLSALYAIYYCFSLRPYAKNLPRSLIKEPKVYLWDWTNVRNQGQRYENFVACHLLKAVHFWNDRGFGDYRLWFLRDKDKREVDFLVTKDNKPWILSEVKSSQKEALSKQLFYFQKETGAKYAFQVVFDMEYISKDCFTSNRPMIVPVQTFLSQLV